MKTKLLFTLFLLTTLHFSFLQAQDIGLIGDFNGWSGDVFLTTTDDENYSINDFVLDADGGVKFRQDADWAVNWGADSFPSGTGVQDGPNIPALAGTYNVTFNIITGEYLFDEVLGIDDISNSISVFYTNNLLNIKGYSGTVTINAFDISGRLLVQEPNIEINSNFSIDLNLPKNQVVVVQLEGNNFKKLVKIITK